MLPGSILWIQRLGAALAQPWAHPAAHVEPWVALSALLAPPSAPLQAPPLSEISAAPSPWGMMLSGTADIPAASAVHIVVEIGRQNVFEERDSAEEGYLGESKISVSPSAHPSTCCCSSCFQSCSLLERLVLETKRSLVDPIAL